MQDRAWLGSVGWGRAGQRQAECNRAAPDRSGRVRKDRTEPDRTGQGHEGSVSALQGWARPDKIWHCQQNRTGAGRALLEVDSVESVIWYLSVPLTIQIDGPFNRVQ